jgi:hypothetical protein
MSNTSNAISPPKAYVIFIKESIHDEVEMGRYKALWRSWRARPRREWSSLSSRTWRKRARGITVQPIRKRRGIDSPVPFTAD